MRKKLLVSGVCGCAAAVPAVALAAPLHDDVVTASPAGGSISEAKLMHDAAAKLHTAVKTIKQREQRHRRAQLAKQQQQQQQNGSQTAAVSGGASDQTATASTSASAPASLQAIAQCESSGNPGARSGQYGGLYQFDQQTWESVGGSGDPASASPQEQTMRAEMLMAQRGTEAWPVCGAGK